MSLVILAESESVSSQRLMTAATSSGHEVRMVDDLEAALGVCERENPAVLVIGPSLVSTLAYELVEYLSAAGRTEVVLASKQADAATLKAALRAGATDVVSISDDMSEIAASIDRAAETASKQAAAVATTGQPQSEAALGSVITVFSTKGGVGKTVLATNLGASIAKLGKRVAILDLDLEFGDCGIMLGLKPNHTIFDAMQAFDRLDETMLGSLLETHVSGARVMLAPVRPEDAENITSPRVTRLIHMLRSQFDYVVIDTSPSFSDVVLAALDKSDQIVVLTMMDVASIKNTRISLQKLAQLGYNDGRVKLVLNRADSKVLLELSDVVNAMTGEVVAYIPSDRVVPRSVNKGVPVVMDAPKTAVSRSIVGLAQLLSANGMKGAADVA